ncbi:hypothetical protein B4113_2522 [Geobacillus sp. B4113_201601]|nr:hypothetical protein B4113_2522 [Geobacillus sp. B4113_201601]
MITNKDSYYIITKKRSKVNAFFFFIVASRFDCITSLSFLQQNFLE